MSKQKETIPGLWDYIKCLFAAFFLPYIGGIWVIIKGVLRLCSKNIKFFERIKAPIYTRDRRYKSGYRIEGYRTKRVLSEVPIEECSQSEVRYFRCSAIIYILIGICSLMLHTIWFSIFIKEQKELEHMVHWTKLENRNDIENLSTCSVLLPQTENGVSIQFALISEDGEIYLCRTGITSLYLSDKYIYNESSEYKGKISVVLDGKTLEYKVYSKERHCDYIQISDKITLNVQEAYAIKNLRYWEHDSLVIFAEGKKYVFDLRVSGW